MNLFPSRDLMAAQEYRRRRDDAAMAERARVQHWRAKNNGRRFKCGPWRWTIRPEIVSIRSNPVR